MNKTSQLNGITFAIRLKKARTLTAYTQQEIADILGVTRGAVNNWETGGNYPTIASLKIMAACYGVSIDWLLGD